MIVMQPQTTLRAKLGYMTGDGIDTEQRRADAARDLAKNMSWCDEMDQKVRETRRAAVRNAHDAGLTIKRIAELSGVARSTVYDWLHDN